MKRALQPSVTGLEVDFDLPSGFEAFQAPSNIPTIFNGDKIVIYGILKSKAASDNPLQSGVQGKASLKGQISGRTVTHSISFDIHAPPLMGEDQLESRTGFNLPVVHHLAAKSLLSDWKAGKGWGSTALTQEREQESTNLSIESSVICEHTAFVAIDEEQKKPIEGAITLCDITATMAKQSYGFSGMPLFRRAASSHSMASANFFGAPPGGAPLGGAPSTSIRGVPRRSRGAPPGGAPPPPPSYGAPPPSLGAPPPLHFQASVCGFVSFNTMAAAPAPPTRSGYMSADLLLDSDIDMFSANLVSDSSHLKKKGKAHQILSSSMKISKPLPSELMTTLISLQHANGFWLLKDISEKIVKKSESELQQPPNVSGEIWATIVALVFLESRCSEQKDEWELVALKAEMWLSTQTLPSNIESLKKKAESVI